MASKFETTHSQRGDWLLGGVYSRKWGMQERCCWFPLFLGGTKRMQTPHTNYIYNSLVPSEARSAERTGGVWIKSRTMEKGTCFFFGGGGLLHIESPKKKHFLFWGVGGWVCTVWVCSGITHIIYVYRSYMILLGFDYFLFNIYSFEGKWSNFDLHIAFSTGWK